MPELYERVRDSEFERLKKKGMSEKAAYDKAQSIAAGYYNKHAPNGQTNPWLREKKSKRKSGDSPWLRK